MPDIKLDWRFLRLWRLAIDVQEGRLPDALFKEQAARLYPENWSEAVNG